MFGHGAASYIAPVLFLCSLVCIIHKLFVRLRPLVGCLAVLNKLVGTDD